ncbi:MAG: acyl-CoA dehydrogenase family protein [Candidatus Lambdaproteobacteria bacterium]|nr:acyl-CoA dehydrogenase family protein [Candidatus Lambdaproteobacteria bacterium]
MNFALSEEQEMLQKSARDFVARESNLKRVRALREDKTGFSPEVWKKMAELGWLGIPFPEEYGGLGQGVVETIVVMEELGRGLMPEPFLSTVLLAGNALLLAGSEDQKKEWLPKIVEGQSFLTLGYQERDSRYEPFSVKTEAKKKGSKWTLNGEKAFVPDAHVAERIIVTARTKGKPQSREGVEMFLVDPKAKGVTLTDIPSMDWRKRALVKLEGVDVTEAERLSGGSASDVLEEILDRATVGLSAEMLGAMNEAFRMTLDYMKTRVQFGVPIGSFQALKHRAADEYVQTELSRSAVYFAAMSIDEKMPDAQVAVSTCKARCNDAFHLIANESIQMHGGIGMTDEHDIGFFFKRARTAEVTLGDSTFHRDRYARLKEY